MRCDSDVNLGMRYRGRVCLAWVLSVLLLGDSYAQEQPQSAPGLGEAVGRARPQAGPNPTPPADDSAPKELSLEQKIGQLLVVTLNGIYRPTPSDRDLFADLPPGGVIIPAVARPVHAAQYIAALRSLPIEKSTGIPMFIAANVYALTQSEMVAEPTFMELPSMLSIVAAEDTTLTANLAKRVSQQLRTMGFNMHLGPSLSLASSVDASNASTGSFGSDPARVAAVGEAFYGAFRSEGILAVATGFPGGGGNSVDGGTAVLVTPAQHLEERDLAPFASAVKSGVDIVHIGNTIVPTLDKSLRPASQSPVVVEGLLRFRLGFKGLIIAGPIDGADLTGGQSPGDAAIASLRAGADMLYMQGSGRKAAKVVVDVQKAVQSGALPQSVIDKAFQRVVTVKDAHGLLDRPLPEESAAEAIEKRKESYEETYRIERQAITLVQDRGGLLPLDKDKSSPIGVTGVTGVEELHDALEEYIKKISQQRITTARHIRRLQDFEIQRLTRYVAGMKTAVVVLTNDLPHHGQARLVTELQQNGVRVIVVLLGYPSHLPQLRHADAIVCAYTSGTNAGETMRAVADILTGNGPVAILPAVREIRRNVGQSIPFNVADVVRSPIGRLPAAIGTEYAAGHGSSYDVTETLKRVEWDFGDGKRAKQPKTTHAYTTPGSYTVTLSITDRQGVQSQGTFPIVIE